MTKAVCGGCHTMVLGVPIPDYDPSRDEEEQLVKINGAIHEEVRRLD